MPDSRADSAAGLLAELPEAQASGEQRRIYTEIRRLSGVPMVALIYRHLATIPGALEWAWALIESPMQGGQLQQRAWQLAAAAAITPARRVPRAALRVAGIGADDEALIHSVLNAYNRANPVNLMVVCCLARHLSGGAHATTRPADPPAWQPPTVKGSIPAMLPPGEMSEPVRELVSLLTDRGSARAPSPLWPSLYRHLANWPALLGYASLVVPPEFGAIDAAAAALRMQFADAADDLAPRMLPPPDLPPPVAEQHQRLQAAIHRFSERIPEMVVIGGLLQRALPPAPALQPDEADFAHP